MFDQIIVAFFVLGYLAIAFEHPLGINKTASALITAILCWSVLAIKALLIPTDAAHGVSLRFAEHLQETSGVIFFLIGAMTIVELMKCHGGFQLIVRLIRTQDRRLLLWIISWITFLMAPLLGLLPTTIVMVSLLPRILEEREDRIIFSCMVILAANAGGVWSPIGDVTTTMLWIGGRVSAFGLVKTLFLPCVACMIAPLIYFSLQMKNTPLPASSRPMETLQPFGKRVFFLGLGAIVSVPLFTILTGLPPVSGMLLVVGALWLVTDLMHLEERAHLRMPQMLSRIDYTSILFFLGILLAIAALDTAGLLGKLARGMDDLFHNKDLIVSLIGAASAIIDNVPLTAASMGMYPLAENPIDSKLWSLLAYCVGTGGSVLVIGSAAGVVVMGAEKIDFLWYMKKISLPALVGYLAGIAVYLLLYPFLG